MSWASLGRPDSAATSFDVALAELLAGSVVEVVEDDLVFEEEVVVDDVSVVEAAPGSLMPKFCAATWLRRKTKRRKYDVERG